MISISVNEWRAYLEIEVYGQYDPARFDEVVNRARELVQNHGQFSILEVHHGRVDNLLSAARQFGKDQQSSEMNFLSRLRRYALVSDEPSWIFRLISLFTRSGSAQFRIFPAHERDAARAWVEEAFASSTGQSVPSA